MSVRPRHPVIDGMKRCTDCGEIRPVEQFYTFKRRGEAKLMANCKLCHAGRAIRYRTANAERESERSRQYYAANKDSLRAVRALRRDETKRYMKDYSRCRNFRISGPAWRALLDFQGHRCALCDATEPSGPDWHTDHDHACCAVSGRSCGRCIRGLLCRRCNIALGHIERAIDRGDCVATGRIAAYRENPPQRQLLALVESIAVLVGRAT